MGLLRLAKVIRSSRRPASRGWRVAGVSVIASCLWQCGDGTGAACDRDADCADGLTCDEHEGAGVCQTPHDHAAAGGHSHDVPGPDTGYGPAAGD